MQFIGDEDGPAPTLDQVRLSVRDAREVFATIMGSIGLMLGCDVVHGDLSAFNILWWEGKAVIIDFPQASFAFENPNAFELLRRDVLNVHKSFQAYGVCGDPEATAAELWIRYMETDAGRG